MLFHAATLDGHLGPMTQFVSQVSLFSTEHVSVGEGEREEKEERHTGGLRKMKRKIDSQSEGESAVWAPSHST